MKLSDGKYTLTLEELKEMNEQRILVLDTLYADGGFCIVDTYNNRACYLYNEYYLMFSDYGREWVAIKDPYGMVDLTEERKLKKYRYDF